MLVNFVYAQPVGHAVEALHYCYGYHLADPNRRIGVVLNRRTPIELGLLCPFIDEVHPVDIDLFDPEFDGAAALADVSRDWDWVVSEPRGFQPEQRAFFPGMARYYDAARDHFTTKAFGAAGWSAQPSYRRHQELRIPLPEVASQAAARRLGEAPVRIAVLPGGSSPREYYPSVDSWLMVLQALVDRFPEAVFCFVAKFGDDGRTSTSFGRAELDRLVAAVPRAVEVVDVPLIEQLAAVKACDLLLSPHSGFGMAAMAVGTPWLSIAGNKWPEYYFTGVPFYSVLPDLERFPCYSAMLAEPDLVTEPEGPRTPSMSRARLESDLAEIVDGAARLVQRQWDYPTALADHFRRLGELYQGRTELFYSIDGAHEPFVAPAAE